MLQTKGYLISAKQIGGEIEGPCALNSPSGSKHVLVSRKSSSRTMHSDEPQVVLVVDNHSSKLGASINQCQIWSKEQGFAGKKFSRCLGLVIEPWSVCSSWNFGEDCRQGSTGTFVADAGVRIAVENYCPPARASNLGAIFL